MSAPGIGVIGCGGMGRSLLRRLLEVNPELKSVAILDPDPRSLEAMMAELPEKPIVCPDLDAMWRLPELQWVMIASWNCHDAEQILAAFSAGREVFCQKPLATNLEDVLRIATAWRTSGRRFSFGFTLRYAPHDSEGRAAYQTWAGLVRANPFTAEKDIVDHQVAILEYANGVRATFHTNLNAGFPERRMLLLGSEGAIRADLGTGAIDVRRIGFDTPVESFAVPKTDRHGGGDAILAGELADTMLHGKPPSVGLPEALDSTVTCFAIDQAMEERAVIALAPYWKRVDAALATPA